MNRWAESLRRHVADRPADLALIARRNRRWIGLTWRDLHDALIDRLADGLGDRFGVMCHRSEPTLDSVLTSLACMVGGVTEAPLDGRLPDHLCEHRREVIESSSLPDAAALILWTSGTGGAARGVVLDHDGQYLNALAKLARVPQAFDDVRLTVLPISHAYARTCDLGTWLISGCRWIVTLGIAGLRTTAADLAKFDAKLRISHINAVPIIESQLRSDFRRGEIGSTIPSLEDLRVLGVGGAAVDDHAIDHWKHHGVDIVPGYGLTEAGPVVASASPGAAIAGHVGRTVDRWDARTINGELYVRGPSLALGSIGVVDPLIDSSVDPPLHKRAQPSNPRCVFDPTLDGRRDARGWFATGDRVRRGCNDQWQILGRIDDVVTLANGVSVDAKSIERSARRELHQYFDDSSESVFVAGAGGGQLWINCPVTHRSSLPSTWRSLEHPSIGRVSVHQFEPPIRDDERTDKGEIRRNVRGLGFGHRVKTPRANTTPESA